MGGVTPPPRGGGSPPPPRRSTPKMIPLPLGGRCREGTPCRLVPRGFNFWILLILTVRNK
jgi:hypothetical protein